MSPAAGVVRLGLIGAGRWGRNFIRTIAALPEAHLSWLSSGNPDSAALIGADCRLTDDWKALVAADDVDGVIVATPPPLHAPMIREAVVAGKPVLVEKPLTGSLAEARELAGFVTAHGGYVLVDHTLLFHAGFAALKQALREMGPVRAIHATAGNSGPFRRDTPPLWDWGPHDVALCLDLLGARPDAVEARCLESRVVEGALAERIELTLTFPGNVTARISVGNLMPEKVRCFRVEAREGTLILDDLAASQLVRVPSGAGGGATPIPLPNELPLTRVVRHFAQAIATRTLPLDDLHFAVGVVETLERCERALGR